MSTPGVKEKDGEVGDDEELEREEAREAEAKAAYGLEGHALAGVVAVVAVVTIVPHVASPGTRSDAFRASLLLLALFLCPTNVSV